MSFTGMEIGGYHTKKTRNPARDYPRAISIAVILIVGVSILATLAIAFVVPQAKLNLVGGLMQAFAAFFHALRFGGALGYAGRSSRQAAIGGAEMELLNSIPCLPPGR